MLAVGPDGTIALRDAPDDAVTWGSEGLHVRFTYWRIGRGRRTRRPHEPAFDVVLVTRADNVLEITDHRTAPYRTGRGYIGLGALMLALGLANLGAALSPSVSGRPLFAASGLGWATLGGFLLGSGIYTLKVADTTVRL
jgi:hypothetical protein